MVTARPARARTFAPLVSLVLVGLVITLAIFLRPGSLYGIALAVLLLCLGLILGAFAARRRRPRNEIPAVEQIERWIGAAAGWPDAERARALLRRLGEWPHLLDDLPSDARARVDRLVSESGTGKALEEWLDPSHPEPRRIGAAHVLGWIGRAGAEERLMALLRDTEPAVAYAAASALLRVGTEEAYAALLTEMDQGPLPASRLAALLEDADAARLLPVLRRHAGSPSALRRFWVAHLAGLSGDPAALPLIVALADDPDLDVRANAAEALGRLGSEEARTRLEALLGDPSWVVQSHAARALGALGPAPSVAPLARLLDSPHWWVRENVVRALEQGGAPIIPALRAFLHTLDGRGCRSLVDVLVRLGYVGWAEAALGEGAGHGAAGRAGEADVRRDLRILQAAGAGAAIPAGLRTRLSLEPAAAPGAEGLEPGPAPTRADGAGPTSREEGR